MDEADPENYQESGGDMNIRDELELIKVFQKIEKHLEVIAGALVCLVDKTSPIVDEENKPQPCQHPEEQRRNLSSFGKEHWICKICGYEYLA